MVLEGHLAEAHRQATRLLKRQSDLGVAVAEFGAAMAALGALEDGHLATAFTSLGDKAAAAASTSQVCTACLASSWRGACGASHQWLCVTGHACIIACHCSCGCVDVSETAASDTPDGQHFSRVLRIAQQQWPLLTQQPRLRP